MTQPQAKQCQPIHGSTDDKQQVPGEDNRQIETGGRSYEPGFENDVRYGSEAMRHLGGGNNYGKDWQANDHGRQTKPDSVQTSNESQKNATNPKGD